MGRLKEILNNIKEGWNGLSKGKKVVIGIVGITLIISFIAYYFLFGKVSYAPIFTNLDIQDSSQIVNKLKEKNIEYKIENGGRKILVPENGVEKLRLDLAIDGVIPNNGKGYEIFDDAGFAVTDEDRKIMYQRAMEGELQRSIMSLSEVKSARVHIAMPEETIFTKETKLGSASVILKLEDFKEINNEQIRGIISLVSGAIKDLPEENVRVLDSRANLLSRGVLNEDKGLNSKESVNERMNLKRQFEKSLEDDLQTLLGKTLGLGNVVVQVSADLDFDSKETTVIKYADDGVIRSEQKRIQRNDELTDGEAQSPIDNNMQNVVDETEENAENDESVTNYESIKNYEIGETTTRTMTLPGKVLNISTSVVCNEANLSEEKKNAIRDIVIGSIGYKEQRGDIIKVVGMEFNNELEEQISKEFEPDTNTEDESLFSKYRLYVYAGIALLGLLGLIIVLLLRKRSKKRVNEETKTEGIDYTVNDDLMDEVTADSDDFERMTPAEEDGIEKQVKEFAKDYPDNMAELIKAWVAEDER
ncbi:MAG: flagellar M-ring protein FliF [Firmicutes bacterium]|nr:flagellar M-ring protein FliF [Bacillota bacterium]